MYMFIYNQPNHIFEYIHYAKKFKQIALGKKMIQPNKHLFDMFILIYINIYNHYNMWKIYNKWRFCRLLGYYCLIVGSVRETPAQISWLLPNRNY